jgi:hypothetical protein
MGSPMKRTIMSRVARLEDRVISARRSRIQIRVVQDPETATDDDIRARNRRSRSALTDSEDAGCTILYISEDDMRL